MLLSMPHDPYRKPLFLYHFAFYASRFLAKTTFSIEKVFIALNRVSRKKVIFAKN